MQGGASGAGGTSGAGGAGGAGWRRWCKRRRVARQESGGTAHVGVAAVVVHEASEAALARVGCIQEAHHSAWHLHTHRIVTHLVGVARLVRRQVQCLSLVVEKVGPLRDGVLGEETLALVLRVQYRKVPAREEAPAQASMWAQRLCSNGDRTQRTRGGAGACVVAGVR